VVDKERGRRRGGGGGDALSKTADGGLRAHPPPHQPTKLTRGEGAPPQPRRSRPAPPDTSPTGDHSASTHPRQTSHYTASPSPDTPATPTQAEGNRAGRRGGRGCTGVGRGEGGGEGGGGGAGTEGEGVWAAGPGEGPRASPPPNPHPHPPPTTNKPTHNHPSLYYKLRWSSQRTSNVALHGESRGTVKMHETNWVRSLCA